MREVGGFGGIVDTEEKVGVGGFEAGGGVEFLDHLHIHEVALFCFTLIA